MCLHVVYTFGIHSKKISFRQYNKTTTTLVWMIATNVTLSHLCVSILFICYFSNYLGDQLRWAFVFLVACHCALYHFLFHIRFVHSWLNKLIDWLIDRQLPKWVKCYYLMIDAIHTAGLRVTISRVSLLNNCESRKKNIATWTYSHTVRRLLNQVCIQLYYTSKALNTETR